MVPGSSATGIPRNAINKRNVRPVKLRQRLDWVRPRDRRDQGSEKDQGSKIEAEMPDGRMRLASATSRAAGKLRLTKHIESHPPLFLLFQLLCSPPRRCYKLPVFLSRHCLTFSGAQPCCGCPYSSVALRVSPARLGSQRSVVGLQHRARIAPPSAAAYPAPLLPFLPCRSLIDRTLPASLIPGAMSLVFRLLAPWAQLRLSELRASPPRC